MGLFHHARHFEEIIHPLGGIGQCDIGGDARALAVRTQHIDQRQHVRRTGHLAGID